jgi:Fe2+ transport system protein FeoA
MGTRERDEFVEAQGRLYAMGIVEGDGLRIDDDRRVKRLWSDDR